MTIYSVFDPEFKAYGRVVTGMEEVASNVLAVLKEVTLPDDVQYIAKYSPLEKLPDAVRISDHLYGGMPVQLGYCCGHNTRLNCLEYHRDSEYNIGTEDFILLLALVGEIENGRLDTANVKAFRVPAGILIECFSTTLHYAPCQCDREKGFKVMVALAKGTNTEKPMINIATLEDKMLWARNKWLLAHKDSSEAAAGAYIGLIGENIDIEKIN